MAEVGAAVGGEGEGDAVGIPGSAGAIELAGDDVATVAFGLLEGTGDVDVFAFGFDDGYGVGTDEEDVVGRAAHGGPFGDGEVAAFDGAGAEVVAQSGGVDLPAGLAELFIDELAGGGFVELNGGGGFSGGVGDAEERLSGLCGSGLLLLGEALFEGKFGLLFFDCDLFPEGLLVFGFAEFCL